MRALALRGGMVALNCPPFPRAPLLSKPVSPNLTVRSVCGVRRPVSNRRGFLVGVSGVGVAIVAELVAEEKESAAGSVRELVKTACFSRTSASLAQRKKRQRFSWGFWQT